MPAMATLVVGGTYAAREAAIAAALQAGERSAVILEGLPDGKAGSPLERALAPDDIRRIAPGCLCCTGNLTMRVTLNRVLRHPPQRLFISLADAGHLAQIHAFLDMPSYQPLLTLTDDLHISP
jgi:G3E family GTPase